MRDLFSKVMTGSMVAGAALLVAACGGGESTEANNASAMNTEDALMPANDTTMVDAMNGADANLGATADMNMSGSTTTMNTTTTTGSTDMMSNTGTGTGNTTGM